MKKNFLIAGLLLLVTIIMGCNNGANPNTSGTEKFTKTTVFNPNSTKVKLLSMGSSRAARTADEDVICEVEPHESKEVTLGDEHEYFFTDENGNKIADLSKSDNGQYLPVYLELNEPVIGKEYMLLNQYKTDNLLESFTRYDENGQTYETYGLLLYEVVNKDDLDSFKYDNNTYIRIYPSANYWIDSEGYASNKIGTKITFNKDFSDNFTPLSERWVAWGWSTKNSQYDLWFCHRVVSYILHAKDGDTYTVNKIQTQSSVNINIQAVYSENPNWTERWSNVLPKTETTKWKVSEIWFYSTQKLYYNSQVSVNAKELQNELQKIIPGCILGIYPKERATYDGWMPQNSEYAMCMRLESKNCYVQNVWCEIIETSKLEEAYNLIEQSAPNFILNY